MVKKPTVIWNKRAEISLKKAYQRIAQESPQNANVVRAGILSATKILVDYPEMYPLDRFKRNNPGNYRAFEKYSYRIAYRHTSSEIRILRVRYVGQEPLEY